MEERATWMLFSGYKASSLRSSDFRLMSYSSRIELSLASCSHITWTYHTMYSYSMPVCLTYPGHLTSPNTGEYVILSRTKTVRNRGTEKTWHDLLILIHLNRCGNSNMMKIKSGLSSPSYHQAVFNFWGPYFRVVNGFYQERASSLLLCLASTCAVRTILKSSSCRNSTSALEQLPRILSVNQVLVQWLETLKVNIKIIHLWKHMEMKKIDTRQAFICHKLDLWVFI
jgi:hypothetical protein